MLTSLSIEQTERIQNIIDNFIENPSAQSAQDFKSLFDLDKTFAQNLIDDNSSQKAAEDIRSFIKNSPVVQYIRDYLSASADIETVFVNTANHDYQQLPYSTKLAQIIHTPLIFEELCKIHPLNRRPRNANDNSIEDLNALAYYETLSGCDIQKNKNITQYIDSDYNVFSYTSGQNIFFLAFMPKNLLIETLDIVEERQEELLKNYLIAQIKLKNPNEKTLLDIQKIEEFLPQFKEKAENVFTQNIDENEKAELLFQEIEKFHNSFNSPVKTDEMKYLSYFWSYPLFSFSLDGKQALLEKLINKSPEFKKDERLLVDLISGFNSISTFSHEANFTVLSIRKDLSAVYNKAEIGALLNAAVYYTVQNQIDKEKKYLEKQFTAPAISNTTDNKKKQKI